VTQMDQVTQQNAALVEEMAAAASSLSHQAQALVGAVAVFKLSAEQARAPQPGGAATSVPHPAPPAGPRNAAGKATLALRSASAPASKKVPTGGATPSTASRATGTAPQAAPQAVAAGAEDDWESF